MTKRKIIQCVECPDRYDQCVPIIYCDACDYSTPFNEDESTIDCSYGE